MNVLNGNRQSYAIKCVYRSWRVTTACVGKKSSVKSFVAQDEPACNLINHLQLSIVVLWVMKH